MTRKSTKILALLLVLSMAVSLALTSCGKKSVNDQINSFIATIQDELDEVNDDLGDMIDMKVEARDGSLVYSYQYTFDLGVSNEYMAELLGNSLESGASAFENTYSKLKKEIPEVKSVIVEYLDMNGTLIVSKEFK